MELEAVIALQFLCKQPSAAGKEHPRGSSARVTPSHLSSDYQELFKIHQNCVFASFVIHSTYQINL